MTYSQDDSTNPVQGQAGVGAECPVPPTGSCFPTFDPKYESKIPKDVMEELEAARKSKQLTADDVCAGAKQAAGDTRSEALSKFNLAEAKYTSAEALLRSKTENAKEKLSAAYKKCLKDSRPKNCESDDYVPEDKKAICVVKLELDLSTEDKAFMSEMDKIDKTISEAKAEWKKAQEVHRLAICLADKVKDESYKKAEVEFREALSEAFGEVCG